MAKVEPLGFSWKALQKYAHGFGYGPVRVYAPPPDNFHVPDNWYPDLDPADRKRFLQVIEHSHEVAAAQAVRMWNNATGVAVFQLVGRPDEADIIINAEKIPGMKFAGEGGPTAFGAGGSEAEVDLEPYIQWTKSLVGHELGHALGFAHPDTPATEAGGDYADPRLLMSGGLKPSPAEARTVAHVYGAQPETAITERSGPKERVSAHPPQRTKKAPKRKPGPTDNPQQR